MTSVRVAESLIALFARRWQQRQPLRGKRRYPVSARVIERGHNPPAEWQPDAKIISRRSSLHKRFEAIAVLEPTVLRIADRPFTLGICGWDGRYVHATPDFVVALDASNEPWFEGGHAMLIVQLISHWRLQRLDWAWRTALGGNSLWAKQQPLAVATTISEKWLEVHA